MNYLFFSIIGTSLLIGAVVGNMIATQPESKEAAYKSLLDECQVVDLPRCNEQVDSCLSAYNSLAATMSLGSAGEVANED